MMAQGGRNQNLVWCIDSPSFGGSERDLVRVVDWASGAQWNQMVVNANPLDSRLARALAERGVDTRPIHGRSPLAGLPGAWRAAGQLIADLQGARWIVWCHHYNTCRWLQLRLAASGERFVVAERAMAKDRSDLRRSRLTVPLKFLVGRRALATVVPGHAQVPIYRSYFGLPSAKVRCIPNCRDIGAIAARAREFHSRLGLARELIGVPPATAVIVCVGSLEEGKAQTVLVHALALLREQGLDVHLCLVGDGPERARIAELADRLLPGAHSLAGEVSDPIPYLAVADVFAFPSRHEGLPGALIEAMAAGVPVAVSDIPSNRELVEHERTGLVFAVDATAGAATAIRRLLTEPGLADRCRTGALDVVTSRYDSSIEKVAWLSLIEEMGQCRAAS